MKQDKFISRRHHCCFCNVVFDDYDDADADDNDEDDDHDLDDYEYDDDYDDDDKTKCIQILSASPAVRIVCANPE